MRVTLFFADRWHPSGMPSSSRAFPVVSLRSTTGYRMRSLRDRNLAEHSFNRAFRCRRNLHQRFSSEHPTADSRIMAMGPRAAFLVGLSALVMVSLRLPSPLGWAAVGRAFGPRDRVVATTQPVGLGCRGPGLWPLRMLAHLVAGGIFISVPAPTIHLRILGYADGTACGVFGRAFSPRDRVVATTQPAGLGWHGAGPLALKSSSAFHNTPTRFLGSGAAGSGCLKVGLLVKTRRVGVAWRFAAVSQPLLRDERRAGADFQDFRFQLSRFPLFSPSPATRRTGRFKTGLPLPGRAVRVLVTP